MRSHIWQFVGTHIGSGTPGNDVPLVVAVCERCGEVPSARALTRPHYERVDLSSECPDTGEGLPPQVPEVRG